tara:strand:- start:668 stop:1159 length:492 start_codon:yes stop_codon:yes gene_type:complete
MLIIFSLLTFCSQDSLPEEQLATDAEMIWCVSNADYVEAGSSLIFTGWDSVIINKNQKFEDDEATRAQDLYRTLYSAIEYYDFLENMGGVGIVDKEQMLSDIESSWTEGKEYSSTTNNAVITIKRWPNYKTYYETSEDDYKDQYVANYVNSYSICKLWYGANN